MSKFNLILKDELISTNAYLKEKIKSKEITKDTAVLAFSQTSGRGRLERKWYSEDKKSLTMSIALTSPLSPCVTLLCALGVYDVLKDMIESDALKIKWPNDIVVRSKKLCGILTERVMNFTVIGIGLNVNNESFPTELSKKATSIFLETQKAFNIEEIGKTLCENLINTLKETNFSFDENTRNKYKNLCVNLGRQVEFGTPAKTGVATDISSFGELIVATDTGDNKISFGDVFVSGIY